MTSYVFLGAIEAIAAEGYLSEKEIKKLTRIKKRKQNGDMSETVVMEMDKMYSANQEFKSEIARGKK